jgi:Zn-dependent M16 (insulinase) family peptidase
LNLLREASKVPRFFESIIEKYLLNAPHRLVFRMIPDPEYASKLEKDEKKMLENKLASLTEADSKNILETGQMLLDNQNQQEDLSVLPTLTINDISKSGKSYQVGQSSINDVPVFHRNTDTNGVSYVKLAFSTQMIPEDLKPYIPLFCTVSSSSLNSRL